MNKSRNNNRQPEDELLVEFKSLIPKITALGSHLYIGKSRVRWHGVISVHFTPEGLIRLKEEIRLEEQLNLAKQRELQPVKDQRSREAKAAEMGLPQHVEIRRNTKDSTDCSNGWVIQPNGVDRREDRIHNKTSRKAARAGEGNLFWRQILPGELVLEWSKANATAPHKFKILHRPEKLTEAQINRVLEIQGQIETDWIERHGQPIWYGWGLGEPNSHHLGDNSVDRKEP